MIRYNLTFDWFTISCAKLSYLKLSLIFSPAVKTGHSMTSSACLKHLVNSDLRSFNLEILWGWNIQTIFSDEYAFLTPLKTSLISVGWCA